MEDAIAALRWLRLAGFVGIPGYSENDVELLVCRRWWTSSNAVDVLLLHDQHDAEASRVKGLDPLHPGKKTAKTRLCWRDRGTVAVMVAAVLNQHAPTIHAVPLTVRRTSEAMREERAVLLGMLLPKRQPGQHMRTRPDDESVQRTEALP